MVDDITPILKKLKLKDTGIYDNHFYVISLKDSNEYAKMYTQLDENAVNTEYPDFETNTNSSTIKVTNYFEVEENNTTYNIFLIADFENDKYYIKIGNK